MDHDEEVVWKVCKGEMRMSIILVSTEYILVFSALLRNLRKRKSGWASEREKIS